MFAFDNKNKKSGNGRRKRVITGSSVRRRRRSEKPSDAGLIIVFCGCSYHTTYLKADNLILTIYGTKWLNECGYLYKKKRVEALK